MDGSPSPFSSCGKQTWDKGQGAASHVSLAAAPAAPTHHHEVSEVLPYCGSEVGSLGGPLPLGG